MTVSCSTEDRLLHRVKVKACDVIHFTESAAQD